MKKILLSIMVLGSAYFAMAQKAFVNDPNAEIRNLNGSFNAIKVSGGIDLYLSQFDTESIAVSAAEQKYKDRIKTVIENGTLKIYYEGEKMWSSNNKKLKAYISFKTLQRLQASGASDVQVAGTINGASLMLDMSGASDFKGAVNVSDLSIELSGASDATISGAAKKVTIESSGASDVKGYNLVTEVCNAKASGASDINITVNNEISASASGSSDISYKGTAVIKNSHSSGSSSVSKKG
jgi:hypothetical protein